MPDDILRGQLTDAVNGRAGKADGQKAQLLFNGLVAQERNINRDVLEKRRIRKQLARAGL